VVRYDSPEAELLAGLVRIDSINPDLIAGAAGEGEIARFVAGWLEDVLERQLEGQVYRAGTFAPVAG